MLHEAEPAAAAILEAAVVRGPASSAATPGADGAATAGWICRRDKLF
jgi:hypothetical protein